MGKTLIAPEGVRSSMFTVPTFSPVILSLDGLDLSLTTLLGTGLILALAIAYLLLVPLLTYAYLSKRWYVASSFERGFMYFLVFFFFPGLLLLSPFLNFRPKMRTIN
jgi:NAD(P)H-quinone oxidoreductase subunit L